MRDMPAPRKNESAAGGFMQRTLAWPYRAILAFLIWTGVRPWQLTAASPVFIVLSGWQIVGRELGHRRRVAADRWPV